MKFFMSCYSIIIIAVIISFSDFTKNQQKDQGNNNSCYYLTQDIETIMINYSAPDTCYKNENVSDTNSVKIETSASQEVKDQIRAELENSYSKIKVKNNGNRVGVFKDGSCGPYEVLDVFMDCEDDEPRRTEKFGWTGDSYVTTMKNVHLKFCVVEGEYFVRTNFDYAVLQLYLFLPQEVSRFERYFDNENQSNTNHTTLNGIEKEGWYGYCHFSENTLLSFYYYPKTSITSELPLLPISYGVLGRFGPHQGYIRTDDEDNNNENENHAWMELWIDDGYYESGYTGNIENIMEVGVNTRLYISKAKDYCSYP